MTFLKRYHLNHKANSKFVLKIVTCIVISWLCQYYNDEKTISKSFEYGSKIDMLLESRSHRVLARYEKQNDIRYTRLQNKVLPNEENYKRANVRENKNTYENLKRGSSNHVEDYLKCYNQRYTKKKGLNKLDCLYEKKLFNSFHKMEKIVAQKNVGKSSVQKLICKKYILPFILLSLIPLFGLTLPLYYFSDLHTITNCKDIKEEGTNKLYKRINHKECEFLPKSYVYLNYFFVFSAVLIIILLIFYTLIKVLKYERIKHGYY